MKKQLMMAACALMLIASPVAAQDDEQATTSSASSSESRTTQKDGVKTTTTTVKTDESQMKAAQWVRTLTNVQIELTLTDQLGSQPPEKKIVSMIASNMNWGKIRSAGQIRPIGDRDYMVELNVDARPWVSIEGPIQLELTINYAPLKSGGEEMEGNKQRPAGINQSQTVILQSGKPLIISQAADPISNRKVVVEVKATVLK
jgi:hypothetical protein